MIPDIQGKIAGLVASISAVPGKMKIIPLVKIMPIPGLGGEPYEVMFNPETYTLNYEFSYNTEQAIGATSVESMFCKTTPKQYTFEFMIDGTGATGEKRDVVIDIEQFNSVAGFKGALHRPSVLLLIWGTFFAVATLEKVDIKYTLFNNDGIPLRATLNCTFKEFVPQLLQILNKALQSPDLTTERRIDAGEKIDNMAYKVYDDSRHYLEVARANGLTNFRKLNPGKILVFPPLEKQ